MAYSYNRRATTISTLPAGKYVGVIWNDIHDLESRIQDAAHEYDVAASYRGKPGEKDAREVLKALDDVQKALDKLAKSGGLFDDLIRAEQNFVKKHGMPEDYADKTRREIYPR